jgi:peptidoglycan/xylan/chitin deacetylase (PgdA/CDA1 family)
VPQQLRVDKKNSGNEPGNIKEVKPWMKSLPNTQRIQILAEILAQCNDVDLPQNKMMNWNEVRQLSTGGFIIGSHSHTHPMLASLADAGEIKTELTVSFEKINTATGKEPLSISYPIGSFDERVKSISLQSGYKFGLAVEQKFYKTHPQDLYAIPRVELYQEAWWKTRMRMSGIYSSIRQVWK